MGRAHSSITIDGQKYYSAEEIEKIEERYKEMVDELRERVTKGYDEGMVVFLTKEEYEFLQKMWGKMLAARSDKS